MTTCEVRPFDQPNFFSTFQSSIFSLDRSQRHVQLLYMHGYLKELGALRIVIEPSYTDADYLEDYMAYYASCFQSFERRCKRVHFFALAFDDDQFRKYLSREASQAEMEDFTSSYLGFTVVRPLPDAVIGRTLLKTYPKQKSNPTGTRNFTTIAKHPVHLFGLHLQVDTLPFQEQDSAVAACATVALWSAFHSNAEMFRTPIPRPSRITAAATSSLINRRPLPASGGLSVEQMAEAVRTNGLDPEIVGFPEESPIEFQIVSFAYAYLAAGIPVILGIKIAGLGYHAITLTGYSLRDSKVLTSEVAPNCFTIPTSALRIDEFYAHDDGHGPFSRLKIVAPSQPIDPSNKVRSRDNTLFFEGSWLDSSGKPFHLEPCTIVVPVYRKIRLSFVDVLRWLNVLHPIASQAAVAGELEWDVVLITTNQYKDDVLGKALKREKQMELLVTQQPRFMWQSTLYVSGTAVAELLADATGFNRSQPFISALYFNDQFGKNLSAMLKTNRGIVSMLESELREFLISAA